MRPAVAHICRLWLSDVLLFLHAAAASWLSMSIAQLASQPDTIAGETPLMVAAAYGNSKAMKVLLTAGANATLDHQSKDGRTALLATAVFGRVKAAKLLLEYGGPYLFLRAALTEQTLGITVVCTVCFVQGRQHR